MSNGTWQGWMYPSEPRCPNETSWCAVAGATKVHDFDDTQVTETALALLANLTSAPEPWFLAVGYRKPHVQWRAPAEFFERIPPASVTLPAHPLFPEGAPDVAFHMPENDFLKPFSDVVACGGVELMAPNTSFPSACMLAWRRAYHASVSFMDGQFGQLMAALESSGVAGDTVVVFHGDHVSGRKRPCPQPSPTGT